MPPALQFFRQLAPLPSNMSSAELRTLMAGVERKAVFAARMNLAGAVDDLKAQVLKYLSGEQNLATGVQNLQLALDQYGYTPERGFPAAPDAAIPSAEAGALRDLSSDARVKLMLQTNFRQAQNFTKRAAGIEADALNQFPAWELVRIYPRVVERGFKRGAKGVLEEVPGDDWEARFRTAGEAAGDDDALAILDATGRMIARKDSPLWDELGNPDNFDDAIGTNYPPFAFNSGMGWRTVARAECLALGLPVDDLQPTSEDFGSELEDDPNTMTVSDLKATRSALLEAIAQLKEAA